MGWSLINILGYISIHSPHAEGDGGRPTVSSTTVDFNPLPPCGGRPSSGVPGSSRTYFNPLPPCGGRHRFLAGKIWEDAISIHSPHAEGDLALMASFTFVSRFQSTPPMRRETRIGMSLIRKAKFQSTPPMRRETARLNNLEELQEISIHSPHAEGDRHRR